MNYSVDISERLKKIITNTKKRRGYFSHYYQITREKGIKILKGRYVDVEKAKLNSKYAEAHIEVLNLKLAKERYYYIPKVYGVKILKIENKYAIGILMQHLGDITLKKYCQLYSDGHEERIMKKMVKELRSVKIRHSDLHEDNLMYYNCRWYAIDFGTIGIEFI